MISDDRLRIWIGFWKWFLSSIVIIGGIAITTVVLDAKRQETELQIKVNQQEKEYLTSFLERALDDNLEKRHRFAQYFASLTQSSSYKKSWIGYLDLVRTEMETARSKLDEIQKQLPQKSGEDLEQAQETIALLQSELVRSYFSSVRLKIPHYSVKLDSISDYKLECPIGSTQALWAESIQRISSPGFKEGYYTTLGCIDAEGIKHGPYTSFYPNGNPAQKGNYELGAPNGTFTTFFEDGKKAAEWKQRTGKFTGLVRYWDQHGNLVTEREYPELK